MKNIFISYSTSNRKFAKKLADRLTAYYDVFIDFSGITGGVEWVSRIDAAICDCDVFIVVVTPESSQSEWVIRETLYAERLDKPCVPVLLSGELPFRIINLQFVDFRGTFDGGFSELIDALQSHAEPHPRNEYDADLLLGVSVRARLAGNVLKSDMLLKEAAAIDETLEASKDDFWARLGGTFKHFQLERLGKLEFVETTAEADDEVYEDRPAFAWSVALDGPPDILDLIDHVSYKLHPTFTPQTQTIRSRQNGFQLNQIGWGTFCIGLTIQLKDGQTAESNYTLTFNAQHRTPLRLRKGVGLTS
ncbi:MAG: TIR domain-containing protein [Cyanobacteria bacterium P01_A01_bin.17]